MKDASLIVAAILCAPACVLPTYEKVDSVEQGTTFDAVERSALGAAGACGLSHMLETECDACIRANCCELAEECGDGTACGEDLLEPISPVADYSTDFDPLLGCMQRDCEQACQVNWGCVGEYSWPTPEEPYSFDVRVVDFAAEPDEPLPDVEVRACEGVDPTCESGQVDRAITDGDGVVNLVVPGGFEGFFAFSGGGYMDTTVQWTEPVQRLDNWIHYELQEEDVAGLALITGVHSDPEQEFDPEAGHLIFRAQNCLPARYLSTDELPQAEVSGVRVEFEPNDGASQVFYTTATGGVSVTLEATSTDGVGGAFGGPARNVSVSFIDDATEREVAEGLVQVRPGAIGFVYMVPRSQP